MTTDLLAQREMIYDDLVALLGQPGAILDRPELAMKLLTDLMGIDRQIRMEAMNNVQPTDSNG